MTDPMTPPDCDLRGLSFMPLDLVRLIDSDLYALSSGEEFKAAVTLWAKSWLQVPAASLPDDDRILAHLSGASARWKKVRDMALRGFVKCSDGRLYHPVVAEKALEAWEKREQFQEATEAKTQRQRRWRDRLKALSARIRELGGEVPAGATLEAMQEIVDSLEKSTTRLQASTSSSTRDAHETGLTGTGTGTGTDSVAKATAAKAPISDQDRLWRDGVPFIRDRGGLPEAQARSIIGKWAKGHGARKVLDAIAYAQAKEAIDPVPFIAATLSERKRDDEQFQLRPQGVGP